MSSKSRRSRRFHPQVPVATGTRQLGALVVNLAENSYSIDASKLEAPARAYDADVAWIEQKPGSVSLMFAKLERDDPSHYRSRLEVRYPPENLLLSLWHISRSFFAKLERYVESWPEEARRPAEVQQQLPAKLSHSEWASYTYMSHTGTEATIDFYHIPPGALARFLQRNDTSGLKVLPVVRVQLTTFELMNLVNRIHPLLDVIRESLPAGQHEQSRKVVTSFAEAIDDESADSEGGEYGS